jgi:hypothetical protein
VAVALPMGWPRHPGTTKLARRFLSAVDPARCLPPFPHLPKLDVLLSEDGYPGAAYEIASPARGLALEVLARAGIDPDEIADRPASQRDEPDDDAHPRSRRR